MQLSTAAKLVSVLLASSSLLAQAEGKERSMELSTFYRTTKVDGLSIFYREADPKDADQIAQLVRDFMK